MFNTMTVDEVKKYLMNTPASDELIAQLKADSRKAVNRLARSLEVQLTDESRVAAMYKYEHLLRADGASIIAGIDEAGRGPLAGPVVVAAVILPPDIYIPKINDSKKLSAKVRDEIYDFIIDKAVEVQRTFISEQEIDTINIYQATISGMYRTLQSFAVRPDGVLIDAVPLPQLTMLNKSIIKGDAKSASIAAASIVAKVERDRYMDKMAELYPEYGFERHKGYGTAEHIAALRQYGPCKIHRRTFEPVKLMLENQV